MERLRVSGWNGMMHERGKRDIRLESSRGARSRKVLYVTLESLDLTLQSVGGYRKFRARVDIIKALLSKD